MAQTLTAKRVERIAPGLNRKEVPDGGLPGLYVIVQPSGAKSWAVRYRHLAKPGKMTLGAFPAIDLTQARKLATAALRDVSEGNDPAAAKHNAATVTAVWEEYRDLHLTRRRDATAAAAKSLFVNDVLPVWGMANIESIRRRDVMKLLDGMRDEPAKAVKAKARLHHFFSWAVEREIINGSPVANISTQHKLESRDRVLSPEELRRIWVAADKAAYPIGPFVKLLILTMARRSEVAQMPWDELGETVWTLGKDRSKNGIAADFHRTAAFDAIIADLPELGDFLFTTRENRPISGFASIKKALDMLIGDCMAPWTFHDIRRTGSTIMQELGIKREVIDACQNHKPQGIAKVYQRYQYAPEKAAAFDALATQIDRIVKGEGASNVVSMVRSPRT